MHMGYFIESIGGPEQGYQHCFIGISNQVQIRSAMQAGSAVEPR